MEVTWLNLIFAFLFPQTPRRIPKHTAIHSQRQRVSTVYSLSHCYIPSVFILRYAAQAGLLTLSQHEISISLSLHIDTYAQVPIQPIWWPKNVSLHFYCEIWGCVPSTVRFFLLKATRWLAWKVVPPGQKARFDQVLCSDLWASEVHTWRIRRKTKLVSEFKARTNYKNSK